MDTWGAGRVPRCCKLFNLLLYRLFLDHDIIFYIKTTLKKFNKNFSKVLNTFENMMEN